MTFALAGGHGGSGLPAPQRRRKEVQREDTAPGSSDQTRLLFSVPGPGSVHGSALRARLLQEVSFTHALAVRLPRDHPALSGAGGCGRVCEERRSAWTQSQTAEDVLCRGRTVGGPAEQQLHVFAGVRGRLRGAGVQR